MLKETLKEIKIIITELKKQADKSTALSGADKTKLEARIAHLNDKSQDHSQSPNKLDLDMNDLDNLETLIGQDKTAWAAEKSQLEKDKKAAETAKEQAEKEKQEQIESHNKTKQEIADKLTSDLVTGLNNLIKTGGIKYKKPKKKADGTEETDTQGNPIYEDATLDFDSSKIDSLKTILEELKTKGLQADLSSLESKLTDLSTKTDEIKTKADKIESKTEKTPTEKGTDYFSIGACVLGGISTLLLSYLAFFKPNKTNSKLEESE